MTNEQLDLINEYLGLELYIRAQSNGMVLVGQIDSDHPGVYMTHKTCDELADAFRAMAETLRNT